MQADDRYDSLFQWYGQRSGVDWRLLKAQARAESGFDPAAVSPVGARGLAQFMARTWQEWADGTAGVQPLPPHELYDPRNPEAAIRAQAQYMRELLALFSGNRRLALAAYNWGPGNVRKHPLVGWPAETRAYVDRIMEEACKSDT
jgi:soluble lytic murein transglycosylase-like protein